MNLLRVPLDHFDRDLILLSIFTSTPHYMSLFLDVNKLRLYTERQLDILMVPQK